MRTVSRLFVQYCRFKSTAVLAQKSLVNKVLNTNPLKKSSAGTAESNDISFATDQEIIQLD